MTQAGHAYGTTLKLGANVIGELTNIGGVEVTAETVDVTSHQSANAYREYIAGLLDTSEIPLEGNCYPGDTNGQVALLTALEARAATAFTLTLPTAFATVFTFSAIVTKWKYGEEPVGGKVPFSGAIKITGKPTLAITASNNSTAITVTDNTAPGVLAPVFAAATYEYVVTLAAAAVTYVVNVTFAAGVCTLVDGNGGTHTLTSTVDSASIAVTADSFHDDVITIKETGKMAKTYRLHILRP